ncbi:MAG: ribonuclease III domain-containing protein [bacterium]
MAKKESYLEKFLKKKKLYDNDNIKEALTHKSADRKHYEKLEFLGDSVLGLCVTDFLYKKFVKLDVGSISKIKGYLVSKEVLYRIGTENDVVQYIRFGGTLKKSELKKTRRS